MEKVMPGIWKICRWVWIAIILAIAVAFVANVLTGKPEDFWTNVFSGIVRWFVESRSLSGLIIILLILVFVGLSVISGIYQLYYGTDDSQEFQKNVEALLDEMKTLTQAHASSIEQLSNALQIMIELHEDNLAKISNSLQATSTSLKILEQQVVLAPLEHLTQRVTKQDRHIDTLAKQIAQGSYQQQKQTNQQKMITDPQEEITQKYQK